MFIEPIGGLIARSLWAEMLDDRKFYYAISPEREDPPPPESVEGRPGITYRKWRPIGNDEAATMDSNEPYVGAQSADLSMVAETGDIIVAPGRYGVSIGGGQPGTQAPSVSASFDVRGQIILPE
jgi:alpha-N-arabinofuranosidase